MLTTKNQFITYATATRPQLSSLRAQLDPANSNLHPSIVCLWYDEIDIAEYYQAANYVIAKLYPLGEEPFYSLAATSSLSALEWQEIHKVLSSATEKPKLRLVSQEVVKSIPEFVKITRESDGDGEHIYNCSVQAACMGGKFEDMRRQVRLFFKQYGSHTIVKVDTILTNSVITRQSVMHLFDDWVHFGTDGSADAHSEGEALKAFFDPRNRKFFDELVIIRIFYKKRLVGFSVSELINDDYALNHFHKTNLNLSGISYYMFYTMMEVLNQKNVKYLNFQEDMNVPGLRAFKEKMRPEYTTQLYSVQFTK